MQQDGQLLSDKIVGSGDGTFHAFLNETGVGACICV